MAISYQVKEGDCLSSIAFEQGFFPDTIWNHSNNAVLKEKRKDPNVLMQGDVVFVPDREQDWVEQSVEDTVRVIGAVNKPGRYKFSDRMSILDLLAEAGGPNEAALQDRIIVVNMGQDVQANYFDLVKFSRTADYDALPVVRTGDTVYVPDKSQSHWNRFMSGVRDASQIVSLAAAIAAL